MTGRKPRSPSTNTQVIGDGYVMTKDPNGTWTLEQSLIVEEDENPVTVAESLVGDKTTARFFRVVMHPGDQYYTAIYVGTKASLITIAARAKGSQIGYPRGRPRE